MIGEYLWYFIRATGIVAYILLYLSVSAGLFSQIRKSQKKNLLNTLSLHQSLSNWAFILTAAHVVITVIDSYVPLTWFEALVPFQGSYEPIGVANGIIAMYLLIFTMITSYARKVIGFQLWKKLHEINPVLYMVTTVHGLMIGSDTGAAFMIVMNSIPLVLIVFYLLGSWKNARGGDAHFEKGLRTARRNE